MLKKFCFRWIPFLATILVVALGIALGNWQTRRGDEKDRLDHQQKMFREMGAMALKASDMQRTDLSNREVSITGHFDHDWPLYLDNRAENGVAGFYVIMPFVPVNSDRRILVMRGWLPRAAADRTLIAPYRTPDESTTLTGVVAPTAGHALQLGTPDPVKPGAILQNLSLSDFTAAAKLPVATFFVQQTSDSSDGLVRDWPQPASGIATHRGYAFQWYALACMAAIFFIVTSFRHDAHKSSRRPDDHAP